VRAFHYAGLALRARASSPGTVSSQRMCAGQGFGFKKRAALVLCIETEASIPRIAGFGARIE